MPCHVRIRQFEGPLELLLSLIEGRKLDITQVSLAEVADQYLERLAAEDPSEAVRKGAMQALRGAGR